ncbi:DUF5344 family protein [Amphibacillus cookii]|uniref:DUF5344 family protein n=1 Tax=Amphibacillus cookii TaxID=767787 RepID=UPI0019581BEF|nr:DUF5344 family protein [Amphibacillus cookii]MBM7542019.1 hypothetical protein [Amphibacillus cookii]
MPTIQLNHQQVVAKIEQCKRDIEAFSVKAPPNSKLTGNHLNYAEQFKERERDINDLINIYLEVTMYNLEDTRANIDLIQEQDASIIR